MKINCLINPLISFRQIPGLANQAKLWLCGHSLTAVNGVGKTLPSLFINGQNVLLFRREVKKWKLLGDLNKTIK
jgi:hypothetical protein